MSESNRAPQSASAGGAGPSSSSSAGAGAGGPGTLAATYPVNTLVELKLAPAGETVRGLVYCTDETSNSIVLRKSLPYTTLTSEITVINASCVTERRALDAAKDEAAARELAGTSDPDEIGAPLPSVSRRALEERERRAIRLAEESLSQVNQRASPEAQKIFDKLLKACNEVVWTRGESILVLKEIRVDPPYAAENCSLINAAGGGLDAHSLERVKKIVAATWSAQS